MAAKAKKACTVNPLKMSQPIGAALAYLGIDRSMPLLHGSQGCTAFGLVLFVRHFRESIPMQTTAMNEVSTILGGYDNLEAAILNIYNRAKPALIGIATTGLTETKGDDIDGYLKLIRERHPELANTELVFATTPDYVGSLQDGWAAAVTGLVSQLAEPSDDKLPTQVNLLMPCHFTPGDIDEIRELVEAFGLRAIVVPDLSGSMDGHIPDEFAPHTQGGTQVADIRAMGRSTHTIAIGRQMWPAAIELEMKTGVPYTTFDTVTGLAATDRFVKFLMDLTGHPVPKKWKRQRSQLQDAMLDGHFHFSKKKIAIAAEPDLLYAFSRFLVDMGAEIKVAVTTGESAVLDRLPAEDLIVGDLEDLEAAARGCDVIIAHSHGRQAAERLDIPLYRAGLPTFDRLGAAHKVSVGYRGSRDLIFDLGNLFIAHQHQAHPNDWPVPEIDHEITQACACH